jgi:SDR family mycofactocin-dependent oxidoreductase
MTMFEGRTVLITGAARGQGRAAAVRFAQHGANVVAFDICNSIDTVGYALSSPADLDETAERVRAAGRDILTATVDVRDASAVREVVDAGLDRFGRLDAVLCNAGIFSWTGDAYDTPQAWTDTMDVNVRGVYHTIEAAVPALRSAGGGSIVITNSLSGLAPMITDWRYTSAGYIAYMASKHGLVGLMRAYALMLAEFNIRVNSIHPGGVSSPMIENESVTETLAELTSAITYRSVLPLDRLTPEDVIEASVWLCSDSARFITGTVLPIDGGALLR